MNITELLDSELENRAKSLAENTGKSIYSEAAWASVISGFGNLVADMLAEAGQTSQANKNKFLWSEIIKAMPTVEEHERTVGEEKDGVIAVGTKYLGPNFSRLALSRLKKLWEDQDVLRPQG